MEEKTISEDKGNPNGEVNLIFELFAKVKHSIEHKNCSFTKK
jgi:hypothetical protein